MSYKFKKRFQITMRILCGLSFRWLLGVAGNSDLDLITFKETTIQACLATASFGATAYLGGLMS